VNSSVLDQGQEAQYSDSGKETTFEFHNCRAISSMAMSLLVFQE